MANPARSPTLSVEDYLEGEKTSEVRHEYVNGQTYAMVGASKRHNRLTKRLARLVDDRLEGTPCESFTTDVKVRVRNERDDRSPCSAGRSGPWRGRAEVLEVHDLLQGERAGGRKSCLPGPGLAGGQQDRIRVEIGQDGGKLRPQAGALGEQPIQLAPLLLDGLSPTVAPPLRLKAPLQEVGDQHLQSVAELAALAAAHALQLLRDVVHVRFAKARPWRSSAAFSRAQAYRSSS
jgi:hypothetical protein